MQKFILITMTLVIVVAFSFGIFQAPTNSSTSAGIPQTVSFLIRPPQITPDVGWNS